MRGGVVDSAAVISSDAIASELFGSHDPREDPVIFGERDRRIVARLERGQPANADSTNVRPEARLRLIELARRTGVPASALRFPRTLPTLRAQDAARGKHVAEIERYRCPDAPNVRAFRPARGRLRVRLRCAWRRGWCLRARGDARVLHWWPPVSNSRVWADNTRSARTLASMRTRRRS